MSRSEISVIIVNYRADALVEQAKKRLFSPLIEIVVIDHSSGKEGFGAGCNEGARSARGDYLIFMNPDVDLSTQDAKALVKVLKKDKTVGMVGPRFTHDGKTQVTCSAVPTPMMALIEFSFLRRIPLLRHWTRAYRLNGFDHMSSRFVPAISGACFAMRKDYFQEIGECDDSLFLYFEEFDLASRLKDMGKRVYFLAEATVEHIGQASTNQMPSSDRIAIFRQSRRYWLAKRWGISGTFVAQFLDWSEQWSV